MATNRKQPAKATNEAPEKVSIRQKVANGVSPHADLAAATELSRTSLNRDKFALLLMVIYGLIAALTVSVVVNVYLGTRPVEYRYFTTTPQGKITELVALNRPIQNTNEVLSWASTVITNAYSMSFANYAAQLEDLKPNFTAAGWRGYEDALNRADFTKRLLSQQYVTTAVPQKAPVVIAEGLMPNGAYAWRLQVPILVTFQSASSNTSQTYNVETTIVRVPESDNPKGLGIAQIVSN